MTDQQDYISPVGRYPGLTFLIASLSLGALVPISFFYVFHRFEQPLAGALLAIGWSVKPSWMSHTGAHDGSSCFPG